MRSVFRGAWRPFALVLLAFGPFLAVSAQDDGSEGAERPTDVKISRDAKGPEIELREINLKIRNLQSEHERAKRATQDSLREIRSKQKATRRSIEFLTGLREKQQAELDKKRKKLEELNEKVTNSEESRKALVAIATGYVNRLEKLVDAGIPWKKSDRLESLARVKQVLAEPKTDAAAALAAVGRLQQEEEALGRLVERAAVDVQVGQAKLSVNAFHLGLLAVIYADDSGSVLGFVTAGRELEDGLVDTNDPKNEIRAKGYLTAVDILRRRRTPGITPLYVESLPLKAHGAQEGEE